VKVLLGHGPLAKRVVVSLCDYTGNWPLPYLKAGHTVVLVDLKHGDDLLQIGPEAIVLEVDMTFMRHRPGNWPRDWRASHVLMAVPCTDFTKSAALHWKWKDARGDTAKSVDLVRSCLAIKDYFAPDGWSLENPAGRLAKLVPELGLAWYFDPCDYAGYLPAELHDVTHESSTEAILASNRYTKETGIWGNNVKPPEKYVEPLVFTTTNGKRGSVMWKRLGGKSERTKTLRSTTPMGFSTAYKGSNPA
jgi:hypothetical protein